MVVCRYTGVDGDGGIGDGLLKARVAATRGRTFD